MRGSALVRTVVTAGMLLGMLASSAASSDRVIDSGLFISKSENKNQVRYSVEVDDRCDVASRAPVRAHWLMLEKGKDVVEPLLEREQAAYGIAQQQVVGDATVLLRLRALPSRPIELRVRRGPDGACVSRAEATIAGQPARLESVHVALGFLRIDHLELKGWSEADGRALRERVAP